MKPAPKPSPPPGCSHGGRLLTAIDARSGQFVTVTAYRWRRAKPLRRLPPLPERTELP